MLSGIEVVVEAEAEVAEQGRLKKATIKEQVNKPMRKGQLKCDTGYVKVYKNVKNETNEWRLIVSSGSSKHLTKTNNS